MTHPGTTQNPTLSKKPTIAWPQIEDLPILQCLIGLDGRFKKCGGLWSKVLGWSEQELLGKPWLEFVYSEEKEDDENANALQEPVTPFFENQYTHKNGTLRWLRWNLVPLTEKQLILATAIDITEDKQNQLLLKLLNEVQSEYILKENTKALFALLLSRLLHFTKSEYGFIGELKHTTHEKFLKVHAITNISWNEETSALYEKTSGEGMEFHNLHNLFGEVITTGQTVLSNNPSTDPRSAGLPHGHPVLNAFLGLPFYTGNTLNGMIGIANRPGGYDQSLVDSLRPFLSMCGNIIEAHKSNIQRKQAETELRQLNEQLEQRVAQRTAELSAIIENSPIIHEFGEWTLLKACQQAKSWQETYQTSFYIAVNVSGKQLLAPDFSEKVKAILHQTRLEPQYLKLEVTETGLVSAPQTAKEIMQELVSLGVQFLMDDFGSGYASLNYLLTFPFAGIKIDRSFIDGFTDIAKIENRKKYPIIKHTIEIGRDLNLNVIAEGIETERDFSTLKMMSCNIAQGYYLSRPVNVPDAIKFLEDPTKEWWNAP